MEQVEEAVHVRGDQTLLGVGANGAQAGAQVVEQGGGPVVAEMEAAELPVGHLVCGDHLQPAKVLLLTLVSVHHLREIDSGPLGGGALIGDPADALLDQGLGKGNLHLSSRQGMAVHPHDLFDGAQLHRRREGRQELLRAGQFQAEVGDASLRALPQKLGALSEPDLHLLRGDAVQDVWGAL